MIIRRKTVLEVARIPAIRAFLFSAAAWLVTFGLLKTWLWREPRSGFFEDAAVYDLGYSALRQDEARAWAAEQESFPDHSRDPTSQKPVVCAALASYSRPQRQYLNETIGSMLAGLTIEERNALNVRLLFAHPDPAVHPDWNRKWLGAVDHWSGYNLTKPELDKVRSAEQERNFYVKGVLDYTYIMRECLEQTTAPFVAIFEDDIIFADGWLSKTIAGLQEITRSIPPRNWLYLRLFYTETSLGWESDTDFWYRNMPLTFLLAMCATLLAALGARSIPLRSRPSLDNMTIAVLVLVTAPAFTVLIFMAGKYTLFPLRGVERMDKHGCCTQALVFPRAQAQDLLTEFQGRDGQTDSMIEAYADERGLERYALAPQVVQHVGLVSSRDNSWINTRSTWAFWFEAQKPERLRQEHLDMTRSLDWQSLL